MIGNMYFRIRSASSSNPSQQTPKSNVLPHLDLDLRDSYHDKLAGRILETQFNHSQKRKQATQTTTLHLGHSTTTI
jgi:hypothetical protein